MGQGGGAAELALEHKGCTVTKTEELARLMRARYAAPEWALFFEVYGSTGWGANRRTDAVAISLYPSRGLLVHGFEFKVSRADWLRELKDPGKAEEVFGYCDHWWLVVGDRSIVKANELPQPWGLIAPRGDGLAIITQAPSLKPEPLDRAFVAALARRANQAASESIQERLDLATREINEREERRCGQAREEGYAAHRKLAEKVVEFEAASGVSILRGYEGGKHIGEAVKAVLEGGLERQRSQIGYALNTLDGATKSLRTLLAALPEEKE